MSVPTVDDVCRAIADSRTHVHSRSPDSSHLTFERTIHGEFLRLCTDGAAPPSFWNAYSSNQVRSVALAVAECEGVRGHCANWKSDSTATFTDEELEVLKGIYVRSVQPSLAPHLRDILLHYMSTTTSVHASTFGEIVLSVMWMFYRLAFAPSIVQDGFAAVVAWVQAIEQLRSILLRESSLGPFLQVLLPMLTLSRYYVIVHRGPNKEGLGLLRVQISQSFLALAVTLLVSHVDDSIDELAKKLHPELLKDLLPLFWHISTATSAALSSGAAKVVAPAQLTVLETLRSECQSATQSSTTVLPSLQEQIHRARSWCSEGDTVQFALQTLANTEVLPVQKVAVILKGLRDAYARLDHSALVAAFSASPDVPPAIRELLDVMLLCVDPSDAKQRVALDNAVDVVEARLREWVETVPSYQQSSASPPETVPREVRLWQKDAELSGGDDRGASTGSAFGGSLRMNGGIW